jgi:hypothetical protein
MFRTILLLHENRCKIGQICAINAQIRLLKLRWNFSQRMHLSQSIRPKTHILGFFGLFHYCTKVNAKLDELALLTHKFAKCSCVEIFPKERTRSTPLDLELMFWDVSDRFITARMLMHNWPNTCH